MNRKNSSDLLPPLPTLSDLAQGAFAEEGTTITGGRAYGVRKLEAVAFTAEEFDAALKGVTAAAGMQFSLEETAATMVAIVGSEVPAAQSLSAGELEAMATTEGPGAFSEDALNCYVQAAALRYTYRLDILTPVRLDSQTTLPRYKDLHSRQCDAVFAHLTGRSEIVRAARGNARWLLRDDERRSALRTLIESGDVLKAIEQARADADEEAQQAAETRQSAEVQQNLDEETIVDAAEYSEIPKSGGTSRVEETLWSYLSEPLELENQDSRQLLLTQQVVSWLYKLTQKLKVPSPERVARQLARETLLQPFRHLTGEWKGGEFVSYFAGRKTELEHLYNYLSVLPPQSFRNVVSRVFHGLIDSAWDYVNGRAGHRPLLIHGPGGVGKSTLLAKFLLDHLTETPPKDRFPYIYVDFDLSALNVREPVTMLAEAARQLAEQYPTSREKWEAARSEWLAAINRNRTLELDPLERAEALSSFAALLLESETEDAKVADQFSRNLPFLLIVDTFEEVQYHDRDSVKDVFRFLNALRAQVPALRCILMGRAPLDDLQKEFARLESVELEGDAFGTGVATDFGVIEVQLGDLDEGEARKYLMNQGVSDSQLAEDLVEVVGGNPLSLRLIARVLRTGEINLKSLREEMQWRPTLSGRLLGRKIPPKALLQGVLFRRILGHIHSKKIQDLAHPGLILRRITPDLIKEVLAGPCGLDPLNDEQALTYFQALAREVSLVGTDTEPGGQNVLRHRPELRRIMLRLMEADEEKQDQIQQVHENAVRYYTARKGQLAQIEALYHRLMLGDAPRAEELADDVPTEEGVEAGYVPALEPGNNPRPVWRALGEAAGELPAAAYTYLTARIHRDLVVPAAAWEVAHPRDRELMILGRTSRRARERASLVSALESLRHDSKSLRIRHVLSPLPLIEVALLERLDEYEEAGKYARKMLKDVRSQNNPVRRLVEYARSHDNPVRRLLEYAREMLQDVRSHKNPVRRLVEYAKYARKMLHKNPVRRLVEYNLLAARIAARAGDGNGTEQFLEQAHATLAELSIIAGAGTSSISTARRSERQLLRFATDSYRLRPSAPTVEIITARLTGLVDSTEGLKQFPALARYVVSSACADGAEDLYLSSLRKLLELVRKPVLLTVVLSGLPKANASRVVEALANWTPEALRLVSMVPKAFASLGKPPEPDEPVKISDYWRRLLLNNPEEVAQQLPKIFETLPNSDARLADLMRALTPEPRTEGEDAFEEARRAGDLMPGEGSHRRRKSSTSKQMK